MGYFYLAYGIKDDVLKIGHTGNLELRLTRLKQKNKQCFFLIDFVEDYYGRLEDSIRRYFKDHLVYGNDWFNPICIVEIIDILDIYREIIKTKKGLRSLEPKESYLPYRYFRKFKSIIELYRNPFILQKDRW